MNNQNIIVYRFSLLYQILKELEQEILFKIIEISDEKGLDRKVRKRLQIQDARNLSYEAKIIRIADKLCNIQDICGIDAPNWDYDRKYEYLQWAEEVVNQIKGTHEELENSFFDEHRWGRLKL